MGRGMGRREAMSVDVAKTGMCVLLVLGANYRSELMENMETSL